MLLERVIKSIRVEETVPSLEKGVERTGWSPCGEQHSAENDFWSHLAEIREKKKWSCSSYKEKTYGDLDYKQVEEEE